MEEEGLMSSVPQDSLDKDFTKEMDVIEGDESNLDGNNAGEDEEADVHEADEVEESQDAEEKEPSEEANLQEDALDNITDDVESANKSDNKEKSEDEKAPPEKSAENEVGITHYAGNHEGFFGIIKQRFSDFLVNEINSAGEIVCITEQMVPHEPEEIPAEPAELPPELTPEKISELNRLVGIKEPVRLPIVAPTKKDLEAEETPTCDQSETEESEISLQQADEDKKMQDDDGEEDNDQDDKLAEEGLNDVKQETVKHETVDKVKDESEEMEHHEFTESETEFKMASKEEDESDKITEEAEVAKDVEGIFKKPLEEPFNKGSSAENYKKNKDKFGKETGDAPKEVLIDVNNTDKEGRTAIHRAVKAKYRVVDSIYKEMEDGGRYILVRRKKTGSVRRERTTWPKSQMYTTFVLYKENIDTMEAINYIAWKTRVKPNNFCYAGTKDRRAKTSQLVSVSRVAPHKLWHATKNHRGIELGNFRFRPTPQKLGQLRGNHFRVVLREVKGTDEVITSAIESLKTTGFINYYGTQRFGTTTIPTYVIGRELLKSNWQQAVNLILAPRENDIPELNRCRITWKETGDAEAALKSLPKGWESSVEAQLLTGLVQLQRNDLVGALDRIPRNTRLLYLHAYQSYLWNIVASRRIEKYGLKVLPGDIVRRKGDKTDEEVSSSRLVSSPELPVTTPFNNEGSNSEKVGTHWWNAEVTKAVQEKKEAYYLKMQTEGVSEEERKERQKRYQEAKQRAKRVVRESKRKAEEELGKYWAKVKTLPLEVIEDESNDSHISEGEAADQEAKADIEGEETNGNKTPDLCFLTKEEAETADISDVLLPLPGYSVMYPESEIKDWYAELLEADGLSFEALKHRVKSYAVGGAYRRLIVRPTNVNGTLCYYKDPSKSLIQSDMDKLRGAEVKDNILEEGPHRAVILEMTLPASSYATIALRELLKMDTSSQFQASLNPPATYLNRNRDFGNRRGMPRGRGGPWRGSDRRGGWDDRGSWKQGTWRSHDNTGSTWRQNRGGGRGSYQTGGDHGGYRGGRDYGWNSSRGGGGRGGYGGGSGWGGRGEKRSRRGGDSWNAKRGRYY
ncbi:pseudouridylate synthase 7 homolog isoform X1 [Cherax quadricarinatus]|uniref:pseudouridylate synthase 7 homolog isoform X1 n=1 Tax=Cherax quadricarinatus TaxID=27406 RepID=UPI002379F2F8|nr:pseudouridylate synthase 7 homolog isoform X1 [Cherax quadricarinatus]